MIHKTSFFYLLGLIFMLGACQDNKFTSNANVSLLFSAKGLDFDTLFSPIGSGTAVFAAYNRSAYNLVIERVALQKGMQSPFLINVNGQTQQADNVRVAKYDSILIFVEVRRDELLALSDSVVFAVNGKEQRFPLRAYVRPTIEWGDTVFRSAVHFTAEKPYLFFGNAVIAHGITAIADEGSELLFERKKGLHIMGNIQVNGSAARPVLFASVRYNSDRYGKQSGQWEGIKIYSESSGSRITQAVISGANTGIAVEDTLHTGDGIQLTLSRSIIRYADKHLCVRGGRMEMDSAFFSNKLKNETIIVADIDSAVCM